MVPPIFVKKVPLFLFIYSASVCLHRQSVVWEQLSVDVTEED